MLTAEPYKIQINNSTMTHRLNVWDLLSTGLKISEILEIQNGSYMAEVFSSYEEYCLAHGIDHSVTRVNYTDTVLRNFLLSKGFLNTETTYQISCRFNKLRNVTTNKLKNIQFSKTCNIESLQSMASEMFDYGRFAEDHTIGKILSDQRYRAWAKDLYQSQYSRIFMFSKNRLIAFMFFDMKESHTSLILGGVSKQYAHMAKYFWSKVFCTLPTNHIINTNISSNNLGVVNLYSQFGFKFCNSLIGYHRKWQNSTIKR